MMTIESAAASNIASATAVLSFKRYCISSRSVTSWPVAQIQPSLRSELHEIVLYGAVLAALTVVETPPRLLGAADHGVELFLGRLHVIGVDEVRERHAAKFVEVPAQHVLPGRIHEDEFAVLPEDREEVRRAVEEVTDVRDRRLVVLHVLQPPARADFQRKNCLFRRAASTE